MATHIEFPMLDTTDSRLSKAADSLESALAQFGKNSSASDSPTANVFIPTASSGSGFDDWLAADLAFSGLTSDDSSSNSSSSPFSALEDSPELGFDTFAAAVGPSLFDLPLGFDFVSPVSEKSLAMPMLTSTAVQQAAAALNIPWSAELESAVMAQAGLATAFPVQEPIKVEAESEASVVSSPVASPVISRASTASPEPEQAPSVVDVTVTAHVTKRSKKRQLTADEEAVEIIAKRAKNTDAARRSRLKKLLRLEGLEAKAFDLEAANNALTMKIAILETEKNGFLAKDAEQSARIAQLEAQLAEAHAALTSRSA